MPAWLQVIYRSVAMFILILAIARVLGKRNIARIPPYKFMSYFVITIIAALISVNVIREVAFGLIALGTWTVFLVALDYLSIKSKWVHDLLMGKETVLIKHGKIMEENLLQTRLTPEELLRELRSKNAFNLADVEFAVMETTGEINVFLKSHKKPVTAHDLGIKTAPQVEPQTVILDGTIINESLASLGLNREWLQVQLESMGVCLDNVFLAQVDSSGDLYIDLFDDSIELPQPNVKEMVYANMEKVQANLVTFSLETQDEKAKEMYEKNAKKLQELMDKLKPYLLR